MPSASNRFEAKDFIETREGLMFAVVDAKTEHGRVLCFLRYAKTDSGWLKMSTDAANRLLAASHADYFYYSERLDAPVHAVPVQRISAHHQPKQRLQTILSTQPNHPVEADLVQLGGLLRKNGLNLGQLGITGSTLVGLQNAASDIDLVCFNRAVFHRCRTLVRELIHSTHLHPLRTQDWQESYHRRSCALSFDEYLWHEQRKHNKALVNGRKFDLSLVEPTPQQETGNYKKKGPITLQCRVVDDGNAFAYPAEWLVDHQQIKSVVSFTATYTGQAFSGELIAVSGTLEESPKGLRVVVGSSREAPGEYIKVVHAHPD